MVRRVGEGDGWNDGKDGGSKVDHIQVRLTPDIDHNPDSPEVEVKMSRREQDVDHKHHTLTTGPPPPQGSGLARMRAAFNLDEGRLECRCLIRKWKFCPHIRGQATGMKLGFNLIKTNTLKEAKSIHRGGGRP